MTREEAVELLKQYNLYSPTKQIEKAVKMAIEALSADTVSREEYEELYRKAKEVNEMANDILADFPSYKELLSVANLKEEFESAEYEDYEHATLVDIKEPLKVLVVRCKDCRYAMVRTEEEMNKPIKPQPILCEWFCIGVENDDYCSHGERRK